MRDNIIMVVVLLGIILGAIWLLGRAGTASESISDLLSVDEAHVQVEVLEDYQVAAAGGERVSGLFDGALSVT